MVPQQQRALFIERGILVELNEPTKASRRLGGPAVKMRDTLRHVPTTAS